MLTKFVLIITISFKDKLWYVIFNTEILILVMLQIYA